MSTPDPEAITAVVQSSVDPLLRALKQDQAAEVRREAALALGRLQHTREIVAALREALSDASVEVRRAALIGLARESHRDAAEQLVRLMEESPELAYEAARGLVLHADPAALPAIVRCLEAQSSRTRAGAVRAIGGVLARTEKSEDLLFAWEDDDQRMHICS